MTDRIKRMQEALKVDKFPLCGEKAKLVIESWKKHEGLPSILSRAHAPADYLDNRTIYVDEDELIVGNVASKPMGLEASCWGPFWDDDDLDSILEGNYTISDEDRKTLRSLDSFWDGQGRQMYEWQGRFYDDERLWPLICSSALHPLRHPLPPLDQQGEGPRLRRRGLWLGPGHRPELFRPRLRQDRHRGHPQDPGRGQGGAAQCPLCGQRLL